MNCTEMLHNIKSVTTLYDALSARICEELSISRIEMDILAFLANNKAYDTASSIVEIRMIPKANVSQGVELLIKKGLIKRRQYKEDRRKIHLLITDKAGIFVEKILAMQEHYLSVMFAGFTDKEKEAFASYNNRISENSANKLKEKRNG